MAFSTLMEPICGVAAVPIPEVNQTKRIQAALSVTRGSLPMVDDESLARYHGYLSANLPLPFSAYYPVPRNSREKSEFRCTVVELLDPTQHLGDEFDGIFCKIRKGAFEVNLPLIELHTPPETLQSRLIEDYWYWFWNWR
jgi:hypothetical protein